MTQPNSTALLFLNRLREIQDADTGFEDPTWLEGWSAAIEEAIRILTVEIEHNAPAVGSPAVGGGDEE